MRRIPVGQRIIEHRQRIGLSQAELARRLRVYRSRLCEWENGIREPRPSMVFEIARELGMTEEEFYGAVEKVA